MSFSVYLITNLTNGKLYVGKTNNPQRRWSQHLCASRSKQPRLVISRAIKKYGEASFTYEVLETFQSEPESYWWESWWVQYLGSNYPTSGYNVDQGGQGGKIPSQETRQKLSVKSMGRKFSPETIAKMSAAKLGKKPSPETLAKLSAARIGKKRSPEVGAKVAAALRGRPLSSETKEKLSVSMSGRKLTREHIEKSATSNRGKKRSPEAILRMRKARWGDHVVDKTPTIPCGKFERSAEIRSRMSAAQKGRGKGIRKSLSTRLKMEAAQSARRAKGCP